ncbi:hypothetical protein HOY80DRAFT_1063575 [Tuber brumale]|nr:hypothetical protein HOY80DRAFT_1063575 [Tuber brumale]
MAAQGNHLNQSTFAGLLVAPILMVEDLNHFMVEEIGLNYTREDEDEQEPGRCNRHRNTRRATVTAGQQTLKIREDNQDMMAAVVTYPTTTSNRAIVGLFGKTHYALATLLYIESIVDEAAAARVLS